MSRLIGDGFGTHWYKCDREDCGLQVVRPGRAKCAHGEPCADADAWMRKNFPDFDPEPPAAQDTPK
jgi:hypothetical protein